MSFLKRGLPCCFWFEPGVEQSATQPFLVSSRNAPRGGTLREDNKNGCVADQVLNCEVP